MWISFASLSNQELRHCGIEESLLDLVSQVLGSSPSCVINPLCLPGQVIFLICKLGSGLGHLENYKDFALLQRKQTYKKKCSKTYKS